MSPLTDEQYERLSATFAASFARDAAADAARRKREGEVVLCLEAASDEAKPDDEQFQKELSEFSAALRAAGVNFSQRVIAFDSADGGGYPLAEYVILIQAAAVPVAGLCGAWIQARYGRKVRLQIGDIEAEGRNVAEVNELLEKAAKFQKDIRNNGDNV